MTTYTDRAAAMFAATPVRPDHPDIVTQTIADIAEALRLADDPRAATISVSAESNFGPSALPSEPLSDLLRRYADRRTYKGSACLHVVVDAIPTWEADDEHPSGGRMDGSDLVTMDVLEFARRRLA